jgi:hypothetical protein
MNTDNVAANRNNVMHHHVLEVEHDEASLLARGFDEVITELVGI